jgi:hypothetical protein
MYGDGSCSVTKSSAFGGDRAKVIVTVKKGSFFKTVAKASVASNKLIENQPAAIKFAASCSILRIYLRWLISRLPCRSK